MRCSFAIEVGRLPKRIPEGVRIRHSRACRSRAGAACDCTPSFEAVGLREAGRQEGPEVVRDRGGGAPVADGDAQALG